MKRKREPKPTSRTGLPVTLAATLIEAEAWAFARDYWARMCEGNFLGLGRAPLDPLTDHALARRWCKFCADLHPQAAEHVVDLAITHGERSAHEALVEIIDEKTN